MLSTHLNPKFFLDAHNNGQMVTKFGYNSDVDSAEDEDIWEVGGTWVAPTSAQTLEIQSSSANDTAAGTGARTVRVFGLDANWLAISEDVTLNGTTTVTTSQSFLRANRAYVLTAGSGETNEGNITFVSSSDSTAQLQISAALGQTLACIYTIPANKQGLLLSHKISVGRAGSAAAVDSTLWIRELGGVFRVQYRAGSSTASGINIVVWELPLVIQPKTDVKLRVGSTQNNTPVAGSFAIYLQEYSA